MRYHTRATKYCLESLLEDASELLAKLQAMEPSFEQAMKVLLKAEPRNVAFKPMGDHTVQVMVFAKRGYNVKRWEATYTHLPDDPKASIKSTFFFAHPWRGVEPIQNVPPVEVPYGTLRGRHPFILLRSVVRKFK